MNPTILFFLVPAVLLIAAAAAIFLWDRYAAKQTAEPTEGNGKPEGAFRAFYHLLWTLVLWSGLALSLPLWVSYKARLSGMILADRWLTMGKLLVFPVVLLLILRYGARQGYLKWIDGLSWPDKENQ
ncbi:MAG: hypothetical protein EOP11_12295 [Proteobacteria bacterium]|nr:MAG: hypothetical protein EOP11_12295 [Pseudomonadota bacterium]